MLHFSCPGCGRNYELSDDFSGRKVRCEVCNTTFYTPQANESVDFDKTIPPQRNVVDGSMDDVTMPGKRDRKPDGRFSVGDLIMNRYKVLAELGQGGMGVVYKCFDETAGIEVALKALPPELSHNTLEMEDIKENFQLVAKLVHQNIAISKNLEKDDSNGNYYLIMECCEGEDLRSWIRRKRKEGELKLEDVQPIIKQVADALDYAHEQKIIHRDIKPGNIMINANGKIKVLDFGLAAQIHTSMTRVSMAYHGTSGTGPYMAPEQWRGRAQGAPTDQYALAVMTYEMLAGHLPFESTDPAVLQQAVLSQTAEDIVGISKTAQDAIKCAMSKEPAERFASCTDFAKALIGSKVSFKINKKVYIYAIIIASAILALTGLSVGGYFLYLEFTKDEAMEEQYELFQMLEEYKNLKQEFNPKQVSGVLIEKCKDFQKYVDLADRCYVEKDYDSTKEWIDKATEIKKWSAEWEHACKELAKLQKETSFNCTDEKFLENVKNNDAILALRNFKEAYEHHLQQEEKNKRDIAAQINQAIENGNCGDARILIEAYQKYYDQRQLATWNSSIKSRLQQDEQNRIIASAKRYFENEQFEELGRLPRYPRVKDFINRSILKLKNSATTAAEIGNWDKVKQLAKQLSYLNQVESRYWERKINQHQEQLREDEKRIIVSSIEDEKSENNWNNVLEKCKELERYDRDLAQQYRSLATAELKEIELKCDLEKIQEYGKNSEWLQIKDYVSKKNYLMQNSVAKALYDEAIQNLIPYLKLAIKTDSGNIPINIENNGRKELLPGQNYSIAVSCSIGGVIYSGKKQVECNWHGEKTELITLDLEGVCLDKNNKISFVAISPGRFVQKSKKVDSIVEISYKYYMAECELTQGQYSCLNFVNNSRKRGDDYPAERISYDRALGICTILNNLFKGKLPAGYIFSLPFEKEWEYAAGEDNNVPSSELEELKLSQWNDFHDNKSYLRIAKSGRKNSKGLYGMYSNVWEWCKNDDHTNVYSPRARRGGSFKRSKPTSSAENGVFISKSGTINFHGVRLALVPDSTTGANGKIPIDTSTEFSVNVHALKSNENVKHFRVQKVEQASPIKDVTFSVSCSPREQIIMTATDINRRFSANIARIVRVEVLNHNIIGEKVHCLKRSTAAIFNKTPNTIIYENTRIHITGNSNKYAKYELKVHYLPPDTHDSYYTSNVKKPEAALGSKRQSEYHNRGKSIQAGEIYKVDCNGIPLEMVKIKAGTFMMGSAKSDIKKAWMSGSRRIREETQQQVTLTKDYWLGKFEVTQAQYQAIMGRIPMHLRLRGDNLPVTLVTRRDIQLFCDKLNEKYSGKLPAGYKFDLPTGAQWEYACRAGTTTALNNGKNLTTDTGFCSNLDEVAWYRQNSDNVMHPVGQKCPNQWGLYDMHGNVEEMCLDYYDPSWNASKSANSIAYSRVVRGARGGSCRHMAMDCRSASQNRWPSGHIRDTFGFRLALVPVNNTDIKQ